MNFCVGKETRKEIRKIMSKSNNVIVLAGTMWQIPLIQRLKEKGYRVIDFNLLPDSPAFEYADEYRIVDILKNEECLKYAKEFEPRAIMSEECDIASVPVAWLSERLGLTSIGVNMAKLYTNKYLMRQFGKKHNFDTPFFNKCNNIDQAIEIYDTLNVKMIMKPLDSNSSRGVYTINNKNDIVKHFNDCIKFSKTEKSVLLEEYIDGTEFTVDGIKTEQGHVSLAVSEKKHYDYNENIACTLYFSHKNENYNYNKLREINDLFVNLTGLPFGLTHAEYKYKDGKFYLIEIGARGGGNLISAIIVPLVSGVDNYEYLIQKTLNGKCNENVVIAPEFYERCAILQFFDTEGKEGVVSNILGEEYLRNCKNIVDYHIYCKIGDVVKSAEDDSKRIGYYIAYGESKDELECIIKNVHTFLKIVLEEQ